MARLAAMALLATTLVSCQGGEPVAETPPQRALESTAVGVHISDLPTVFEIATNGDDGLRLHAPSLAGPSTMVVTLSGEYPSGLNLIDAVQQELDNYDTLPEGQQFGQTQLIAPIGLTYMARGRYQEEDSQVEELKALLVHPWGNRLLSLTYSYPLGTDTAERGAQLMELLGAMEPLEEPAESEPVD